MGRGGDTDLGRLPVRRGIGGVPNRILNWSRGVAERRQDEAKEDYETRSALYKEMLQGLDVNFSGYLYHLRQGSKARLESREAGFLLDPNEIYDLHREEIDGYDLVSWLDIDPKGRAGMAVFKDGKLVAQTEQERDIPLCRCRRRMAYAYDCSRCWQPNGGPLVFKGQLDGMWRNVTDFRRFHRRSSLASLFSGLDRRRLRRAAKKYISLREKLGA